MLVLVQYKTYNRTILQSYIVALPLRLPITSYCLSRVWSCLPCCYTSLQILCCLFWNVYVSMEREKLFMSAIDHPSRKRYYHCLSLKVYHKVSNFQKEHNKHKNACGELNLDANNYEWSENLINYVAHQLCTSASKPGTKRT